MQYWIEDSFEIKIETENSNNAVCPIHYTPVKLLGDIGCRKLSIADFI